MRTMMIAAVVLVLSSVGLAGCQNSPAENPAWNIGDQFKYDMDGTMLQVTQYSYGPDNEYTLDLELPGTLTLRLDKKVVMPDGQIGLQGTITTKTRDEETISTQLVVWRLADLRPFPQETLSCASCAEAIENFAEPPISFRHPIEAGMDWTWTTTSIGKDISYDTPELGNLSFANSAVVQTERVPGTSLEGFRLETTLMRPPSSGQEGVFRWSYTYSGSMVGWYVPAMDAVVRLESTERIEATQCVPDDCAYTNRTKTATVMMQGI